MRFLVTLSACLAFMVMAEAKPVLTLHITGAPAGYKVYLFSTDGLSPVLIDSAKADKGVAVFAARPGMRRGLYQVGPKAGAKATLVLSPAEAVQAYAAYPQVNAAKADKSPENAAYAAIKAEEAKTSEGFEGLQAQYNALAGEGHGLTPADQLKYAAMFKRKSDSIYRRQDAAFAAIAKAHAGTLAAKLASFLVAGQNEQEATYFPGAMAADDELAQAELVRQKLSLWYQRFLPQDLEAYERATDEAVGRTAAGGKFRELTLASVAGLFMQMDPDYARKTIKAWAAQYPASPQAKQLLAQLPPPQPEVGEMAPDIVLKDSAGKDLPLSSLRGKVVLIDFWASWCGPCRAENPNVVKTYAAYKDKGFTIYSVSLDQGANGREKWLAAIKKDGLTWPNHVSDLAGWGSAGARLYKVQSIPATFLIDKEGKIIAKNLRGARLEEMLAKVLK